VIFNVLINAIRAMPNSGKLIIVTFLVESLSKLSKKIFWHKGYLPEEKSKLDCPYVCICVKDKGIGIPRSEINKIFEPFYSTTDGIGLGLHISSKIIEKHKGFIGVESIYRKGTNFYILLPTMQN
jgi:signal transduction histidine kinase